MIITLPVVPHGCAAGDLPDHIQRDVPGTLFHRGRRDRKIQAAQRLAQIAARTLGKIGTGVLVHAHRGVPPLRQLFEGIVQALLHVGGGQGFELEHRAPGQQCIIDVEIRVLGGGCNEGDRAVLDALQQALLLLFVQVLDLVQIQQDAARPRQRADVLEHRLDVAGAAGSAVELVQSHAAVLCDDAGHCGLAGTGRAVEDHVGDAAALNGTAKHPARGQQMLLPAHICQRFGPQALRQWFVHCVSLPCRGIPQCFSIV